MATSFSSLPVVDLCNLQLDVCSVHSTDVRLGEQLYDAFATTGFVYLINAPLSFDHEAVFDLSRQFFGIPIEKKMEVAKTAFRASNTNSYRGYFPVQPLGASDNLKEGFEIGPGRVLSTTKSYFPTSKFDLGEDNVWPDESVFVGRRRLEQLYQELQALSSKLLSVLALSLGKEADFFAYYLEGSLSTLRLLHYPAVDDQVLPKTSSLESLRSTGSAQSLGSYVSTTIEEGTPARLSCTPHTDSGILTLLHQDPTGGLEVRNSLGQWIPAPYIPGSIVVNIGDLMAEVSGGRFMATMHRVRAPFGKRSDRAGLLQDSDMSPSLGRLSVPFFFEPGESCVVRSIDDDGTGHGILYGEHVRRKMKTWVEFQDFDDSDGEQ